MRATVLTHGLHPPWIKGESIVTKNITKILSDIYDEVKVLSIIDLKRWMGTGLEAIKKNIIVKYCLNMAELNYLTKKEQELGDVHIIGLPLIKCVSPILRSRRSYFYQLSYKIDTDCLSTPKAITLSMLPSLCQNKRLNVLTTCLSKFVQLSRILRKNYHYIPAPIVVPKNVVRLGLDEKLHTQLTCTYIGHASYNRFPFMIILKALRKLKKNGYNIKLKVVVSKLSDFDYEGFVNYFNYAVNKLDLNSITEIFVRNLTEVEKYKMLEETDIFLFLARTECAIDPPIGVLEAMAAGCCIIATPIQSVPYLLGDGRGVVIKGNVEAELFNILKRLLNTHYITKCAIKARHWVKAHHDLESVKLKMTRLLLGE